MNVFSAVFFIVLLFSLSFGADVRCGTRSSIEDLKNPQKKTSVKKYVAESLTGIMERRTQNFIIYYVTEGTNAAKPAYIDSLAVYLEQAYKLHKDTLGMKSISGTARTFFYDKVVPSGLYPIEVMDTGEGGYCGTYGLARPNNLAKPRETQIAIENNFIFDVACSTPYGTIRKGTHFSSSENGDYSRDGKWHLALKATIFHELYHSFQMTQFDLIRYPYTFWLEASAAGVEERGAPEVNDYIDYIITYPNPGKTMEDLEDTDEYSYATLYLFLSYELGEKFDSYIWDYFSVYHEETFAMQLARYVNLRGREGENVEDLFHKYATHLFYSGSRAASSPYLPFSDDMRKWPDWTIKRNAPSYLPAGTFDFIRTPNGVAPMTDSVFRISNLKFGNNNDSVWVLSRLLAKDSFFSSADSPPKEFAAYPNPWRPERSEKVKFGGLPPDSKGVEIRTANGALLERIDRGTGDTTLTWQPEKLPAPGILYYRYLPYGKNKMLILEH